MEQNKDTRVIYFSDLFFSVLYAWRKILIVVLVCALLLGGLQTVRCMKDGNIEAPTISEETQQEITKLEERLARNEVRIANLEDYLNKSVGMQLNPYQIYQASVNVYVEAETPELTAAVIWAYQSQLRSYIATPDVAQTIDIDTEYLSELVSYQIVDGADSMLSVSTTYSDAESADQLMTVALAVINDATEEISSTIAPHTIRTISYPTTMKTNQNLQKHQTDYNNTLTTLRADSVAIQKEIDKLNTVAAEEKPASALFAAIVGAFLGAFIAICFVILGHLATDKVYSARTLSARTGLKVVGRMPAGKRCKLDRWFRKLEKRACTPNLAATAATVRNYCGDAKHLLVAGSNSEQAQAVVQVMQEQYGITVTCCGSLLEDVDALQALPVCDAVLLVETCHKSTYADINTCAQMVADQNKSLIGCLLLGG